MSFTLRSFPSSSESSTISSAVSSTALFDPLKSNRCPSSFCACWMALATSCMLVLETTSNENSWAMLLLSRHPERAEGSRRRRAFAVLRRLRRTDGLLLHHLHAGGGREVKEIIGKCTLTNSAQLERRLIAFTVGVVDPLDDVCGRRDGHGDAADHGRGGAGLQSDHDGPAARALPDDEVPIAGHRIADEQKRQFAAPRLVERGHRDLLVAGDVEPGALTVEDEKLLLRTRVTPAHP